MNLTKAQMVVGNEFSGWAGRYCIIDLSISNPDHDFQDGDTRTIKYLSGTLEGRVIPQIFLGPSSTGGWYDID
jgi:hypothetical protein